MKRILLIEDDSELLAILAHQLEKAGYTVVSAAGGVAGLGILKSTEIDIVVTDVIMRSGEGVETLRTMKLHYPDLPVIAMSGNPAYLETMKSLGAVAVLRKPFRTERLLTVIQNVIQP